MCSSSRGAPGSRVVCAAMPCNKDKIITDGVEKNDLTHESLPSFQGG